MRSKAILKTISPYLIAIALMLLPRIFGLDSFVATDEGAWFIRSANFYYALGQREFAETYQNISIAAFTMWINALAFLIKFPQYRGLGQGYLDLYDPAWDQIFLDNQIRELSVLTTGRILMVVAMTIVGLFIFWYLKRTLGTITALFSFAVLSLDPFYLALSRTSHLDAPQAAFMILSILAYHSYLSAGKKWFDLIISGSAGGLSLLSKLTGAMVIPAILGVGAIQMISRLRMATARIGKRFRLEAHFQLKTFVIWLLIFVLVFIIGWPAMWSHPLGTVDKMVFKTAEFVEEDQPINLDAGKVEGDGSGVPFLVGMARKIWDNLVDYLESYLWRTTPVVLLGLLLAFFGFWRKWDLFESRAVRSLVTVLVFTGLYVLIVMSIPDKRSEKYIIPMHMVLDILAGIGWVAGFSFFVEQTLTRNRKRVFYAALMMILFSQAMLALGHFPYYFSYYNPILGGSKRASEERFVGVGEGLDQAAKYLNQLPGAKNLQVLSWYGKGPFSFFFEGQTATIFTGAQWNERFIEKLRSTDYLVVYTNQWYRRIPPELFDKLNGVEPIQRVWIDGIEYARIYDPDDIPLEKEPD